MPRIEYLVDVVRADMTLRGWQAADLAFHAKVAKSTITRFLDGRFQTPRTAKKIARAFGYATPRRYVRVHLKQSA